MSGPAASSFTPGPSFKLGAMQKKCNNFQKWAIRFLILDKPGRVLHYYHSTKDPAPKRTLALGQCNITKASMVETQGKPGLKIAIEGFRDFVFVGTNDSIVEEWIMELQNAKSPSTVPPPLAMGRVPRGPTSSGPSTPVSPSPLSPSPRPGFRGDVQAEGSFGMPTLAVIPKDTPDYALPPSPRSPDQLNSATDPSPMAPPRRNVTGGQLVPFITMTPDNKRIQPVERPVIGIVKIGRFVGQSGDMITFKSKVISRHHAEIWATNGDVYIRDTRSQSGTFLNAMRLSEPAKESKPYKLKSGDVIQFGVDYKNATEDNARGVSVKIDLAMKMVEPPQSPVARTSGEANGDRTLVATQNSERTLVKTQQQLQQQQQQESTLYKQAATANSGQQQPRQQFPQ